MNDMESNWQRISNDLLLNLDHVISIQVDEERLIFVLPGQIEHVVLYKTEKEALEELEKYSITFDNYKITGWKI